MTTAWQEKPFEDLTIIELSSVLAGPAVGLFFAELGAKVIKIENKTTGGDVTRSWKHPMEDPTSNTSAYYHSVNWNKEIKFVNLKNEADKAEVLELIKTADIVISNFRSASAQKLGMDYKTIKQTNPSIIYGEISAYGDGDNRPGFDAMIQAETGWMYMNGQAEGPATKMPVALIDILAAHQLKEGLLVALINKYKSGKGAKVSVSLYDAAVASLANQASNYLNLGIVPQRKGSQHPNIAPYGDIHNTKDGQAIMLAIGNDKQFNKLCNLLSCEELATDPLYTTNKNRVINRSTLNKLLEKHIGKIEADSLIKLAIKNDIPLGRIRNLKEVFEDSRSQELLLEQEEEDETISKRVRTTIFNIS